MKQYRKRIADEILQRKLEGKGAVLIEGPKWCGKTTTAEQIASSVLYMDDPEKREQNIQMAELNPKRLLRGDTPRLIDEWQLAPKLWDAVRFEVDHRGELGQFVLTGSAVPPDTKDMTHSGTGRFTWLTMRPMSLYESGDSTGEVSLGTLFTAPQEIDGESHIDLDRLAFLVCRGGWPQAVGLRNKIALDQAMDYYDAVVHSDINRADNVQKNPERVKRLMRSYARMNDPAQFEQVDATCGLGGVILCLEKLDMTGFAEYSSRTPKMRHKNQTASNRSKKRKNQAIRTRISHFVSAMKFSSIWHGVRFFNVR